MKVIDFIEKFNDTIDVYDNYTEDLAVAYCGEKLTTAGKEHFKEALELPIISIGKRVVIIGVDQDGLSEDLVEQRLKAAIDLFYSIAGGCSASEWELWFTEE